MATHVNDNPRLTAGDLNGTHIGSALEFTDLTNSTVLTIELRQIYHTASETIVNGCRLVPRMDKERFTDFSTKAEFPLDEFAIEPGTTVTVTYLDEALAQL